MDPCPFVRVLVGNLALKIPVASRPARSGVHPSSSPCYCKIRLGGLPCQTAAVPLISPENAFPSDQSLTLAAGFHLSRADLEKLAAKSLFAGGRPCLTVAMYTGCRGTTCGINSGRLLGRVSVPIDLKSLESRSCVFHNGWVSVGKEDCGKGVPSAQVHLTVRADPDPRFVFEFGGDPESSPQVFQVQGNMRQPVFTCKCSCRNSFDRTSRTRFLFKSHRSEHILGCWLLNITFTSSAGQSFGCFLTPGMNIRLLGEANDYVGKVLYLLREG